MKKTLLTLFLVLSTCTAHALSVEAKELKEKLALFDQINASFVQKVSSAEGKLLNESSGEMTILRPGKFHWKITSPEEELIVSNGKTIWYYSPFIEQVTLINFSDAIDNTPFALLAGADEKQWANYEVNNKGKLFTVINPTADQLTTFIFEFDGNNNIKQFIVIDEQGQRSTFSLVHKASKKTVDNSLFNFQIPAGVEVDDQR